MKDIHNVVRMLQVIAVGTRVRIIHLLKGHALCVGALSARLGVTQGAVSQHLRILREAGLVVPEKRGYYVHYRLNNKALRQWKGAIDRMLEPQITRRCSCSKKRQR
jgi:DNA-binding transcriptional ArsR family regulator